MKLIEFSHKAGDWEINNLVLGDLNLIVGENATGKSKTLDAILNFAETINNLDNYIKNITNEYDNKITEYWCSAKFKTSSGEILSYEVFIEFKNEINVEKEILILNNQEIISRKSADKAEIYSNSDQKLIPISPPLSSLVLKVRRDTKEYIEFEQLIYWALNSEFYIFCKNWEYRESRAATVSEFLDTKYVTKVLNDIGFNITNIYTYQRHEDDYYLGFKEENIKKDFYFKDLSQALKRSINLIIFFENLLSKYRRFAPLLVIDDLGEGLDYQKATKLGEYVFETCKKGNIQLIAASNDNFLLDVVDLDYWNILTREGSKVSTINKVSHPKIFEDFIFTGLSNFDLLTSDYLSRKLNENPV